MGSLNFRNNSVTQSLLFKSAYHSPQCIPQYGQQIERKSGSQITSGCYERAIWTSQLV